MRKLRSKDINPCIEVCISMQATCLNEIMPTTFEIYTGLNVNVISVKLNHMTLLFSRKVMALRNVWMPITMIRACVLHIF